MAKKDRTGNRKNREQSMWNFETERINIVYDCGSSTNVKLVEEQIKKQF